MRDLLIRAFELAPECENVTSLKKRLAREGYQDMHSHLSGLGIKRQLRPLFRTLENDQRAPQI